MIAPAVISKTAFAELIGVTPARVSQMIADDLIGQDALLGKGRHAKIITDLAKRQIRDRRHPGQAMGNGLMTRLGPDEPISPSQDVDATKFLIALYETLIVTLRDTYDFTDDDAFRLVSACGDKANNVVGLFESGNPK